MDMKEKISQVDGVSDAFWISDVMDVTIPSDMLPSELHDFMFNTDNGATMLIVRFNEPGSSDLTMNAFKKIKTICSNEAYIGGLSVILQDTKSIVDQEMPYYILIAVAACIAVLWMGMKSNAVPFIFMMGLVFPIIYNFGTNIIFGQISYITEALATVLQLGVTMDYSIFLLHRYEEERSVSSTDEEAMERAIVNTGVSISASSLTTVAGFLALCTMRLTLGTDIGLVMAKGVVLGVLSTITILPAMLLCMRRWVAHKEHKTIIPRLRKASFFVTDHPKTVIGIFLAVIIVFGLAYPKVQQYYTLGDSLPQDMTGIVGNQKLKEDFNMNSSYFVIVNDDLKKEDVANMSKEMEDTEGVTSVLSLEKFIGAGIPEDMLPDIASDTFYANGHEMILVNSQLKAGTDEIGEQINTLNSIVKKYDSQGYITGEAPMTKDLVEIANVDFNNVNWISILAVFVIIAISFKSLSIPVLLVASIESAIVINMAIPYFTGTVLPFIASIVIGTIQLGATVDYAILMTTRFEEELANGHTKKEAAQIAAEYSSQSILASGLTFFGATVGVSLVSKMALLQSICLLIARGALISMAVIIFVLPCLLMLCEPLIRKTTRHWAEPKGMNKK
jgi:predicted RND superfamily exporter protein